MAGALKVIKSKAIIQNATERFDHIKIWDQLKTE